MRLRECDHGGCADNDFKLVFVSMNVCTAGARLNHFACAALGSYGKFFGQRCDPHVSGNVTIIVTCEGDVAERKKPPPWVSVSRFVLPMTARACFRIAANCAQRK